MPVDSDPRTRLPALLEFLDHFAPGLGGPELAAEWTAREGDFLTVLIRTTGRRPKELEEALLCLAAQTTRDFSVIVAVHNATSEQFETTRHQVRQFHDVSGVPAETCRVDGGYRGAPLQAGVDRATSRYAVILDDDDYVAADWVQTFAGLERNSPGRVLRTGAITRVMEHTPGALAPARVCSTPNEVEYGSAWSVREHLIINQTPIHAFAFPLFPVRKLGVNFRTDIPVVEDWDFLMKAAVLCGVVDSGRPTAVYNRHDSDTSVRHHHTDEWQAAEESVRARLSGPLLIDADEVGAVEGGIRVDLGPTTLRRSWRRTRELLDQGGPRAVVYAARKRMRRGTG